jgi:formylmethanofuran dehydrogenase subunit B
MSSAACLQKNQSRSYLNHLVYWNILTMHGSTNVKSPNNIRKWQMGFNSAFKGLRSGNEVMKEVEMGIIFVFQLKFLTCHQLFVFPL